MVTSVKHGVPRQVNNNSPFYITTNHVPDFGNEDENVKRRIAIFNTSLPEAISGMNNARDMTKKRSRIQLPRTTT